MTIYELQQLLQREMDTLEANSLRRNNVLSVEAAEARAAHQELHDEEHRTFEALYLGIDHRLSSANELRSVITEQAQSFLTRQEIDTRIEGLRSRINTLEQSKSNIEGRMLVTGGVAGAIIVAIAGITTLVARL